MTNCPAPATLLELITGSLPPALAEELRAHLSDCGACCAVLDRLTDEDDLSSWKTLAGRDHPFLEDEDWSRLVQRLVESSPVRPMLIPADGNTPSAGLLGPPQHAGDLGVLGHYRIESEIGRGGMGIVFRGHDAVLHRPVAIKVLRPETEDGDVRQRLVREAQAAAQFRHENAASVYSVSQTPAGRAFIVMEYIAGSNLAEVIRREGPIAPRRAAALVAQVADALAAAHAAGLVHQDVKPANILLDAATQRAKLVDFGLASVVEFATASTRERGVSLGGTQRR